MLTCDFLLMNEKEEVLKRAKSLGNIERWLIETAYFKDYPDSTLYISELMNPSFKVRVTKKMKSKDFREIEETFLQTFTD